MTALLSWNFDTSNIPHDRAVILACGDKSMTVTKSRWSDERGAFAGCTPETVIVAWTEYPEHPYKAMAAMTAATQGSGGA